MNGEFLNLKLNGPGQIKGIMQRYAQLPIRRKKRCYNEPIRRLRIIDMENVRDIAFTDAGLTLTLKDGTVTNYVVDSAAPAPSQTVSLASGETLLVTVA